MDGLDDDGEQAALAEVSEKELLIEIFREVRTIRRVVVFWCVVWPAIAFVASFVAIIRGS